MCCCHWALWEVPAVSGGEGGFVVGDDVDFAVNGFLFSGGETADAEVAVEASGDTLEEFLVGLPCSGPYPFIVGAEAADEAAAGDEGAEWAWVDVGAWDVRGSPDLAGSVAGGGGPVR